MNPRELAMADEARSRLGRGLASLIGDVGGEAAHVDRPRTSAQGADRISETQSAQPAPRFFRCRTRRARRLDQAARRDPADRGASGEGRAAIVTRSSPASAAGAPRRSPACTKCRSCRSMSATADALEIAIIENVQREDLNAMEEAQGYHALADEFKRSQEDIAKDRRQEPQPRRQHDAADQAAGGGAGLYRHRANCRPAMPAR